MTYDFANLNHADFEALARALAGRALGVRFEAFPAGPDDGIAKRLVDDLVLLQKALDWNYECEWRLIGRRGSQDSPLEMEEITFGMRCDLAVKYAIVRALEGRQRPVAFYEMHEDEGTFDLKRRALNLDELAVSLPRRPHQYPEVFDQIPDIEPPPSEGDR